MAKKKKNFYAIKQGYNKETGEVIENIILKTWAETAPLVQGVSKVLHGVAPKFLGCYTLEEAEAFLAYEPFLFKVNNDYPMDALHCYMDGSYSTELNNYSFGLVCVKDGKIQGTDKGVGSNPSASELRNVAGESLGAMKALIFAKRHNYKKVVIFFDYQGIALHALGEWDRDTKDTEIYYRWMQDFFVNNPDIEVVFCKVDAHTGDDFNEIADGLAKAALNIPPSSISLRCAKKHGVLDALSI